MEPRLTADQAPACACLEHGARHPIAESIDIGIDKTAGRHAEVELHRCAGCRRLWLKYLVEDAAFSRSGRWAEIPVAEATAKTVTPETAAGLIDAAPWHISGGSFFGHAGRRSRGPIGWW